MSTGHTQQPGSLLYCSAKVNNHDDNNQKTWDGITPEDDQPIDPIPVASNAQINYHNYQQWTGGGWLNWAFCGVVCCGRQIQVSTEMISPTTPPTTLHNTDQTHTQDAPARPFSCLPAWLAGLIPSPPRPSLPESIHSNSSVASGFLCCCVVE